MDPIGIEYVEYSYIFLGWIMYPASVFEDFSNMTQQSELGL